MAASRQWPDHDTPTPEVLGRLANDVETLRQQVLADEAELGDLITPVYAGHVPSARNLLHYLALRRYDIRALQLRLARAGLSSLGRSESNVLSSINRVTALLALARGTTPATAPAAPVQFRQGERILAANARRLLGRHPKHRAVRIVVTLPSEAAEDGALVSDLVAAGMEVARINCARDDGQAWTAMADNVHAASRAQGRDCRLLADLAGPKPRTGRIAGGAQRLLLSIGDRLELVAPTTGRAHRRAALPRITCDAPALFDAARPGEPIWFDDGEIGGIIEDRTQSGLLVRITLAGPDGSKLRPDRGINAPATALVLPAVTARDLRDLEQVLPWADIVGLSFAQRREDVLTLLHALRERGAEHVGIVLKIESRQGFENLPALLLAAMQWPSCGVMIARGDLAVEVGFERMAEIQEEVLWIAEAAHLPTIWATKVLDTLAKEGHLSRAEMTDAAMSARAEAVMLNKGPFVANAIRALDNVLARMKGHQSKKRSLLRALGVSRNLWR